MRLKQGMNEQLSKFPCKTNTIYKTCC